MHVLSASGLTHGYDDRVLFRDLSFGLTSDDRVAIVGPNGSGKSTLLQIVAGAITPDGGEVVTAGDARISHLAQDPRLDPDRPALAVAADAPGVREHEAEALLHRLGIPVDAAIGTLSGGQRRRVALAQALLPPADLLILDEPTNHLDADTIDWLEEELQRRACGLLFVTHDRLLLQRLTTRMLDLNDVPTWIDGHYADVVEARLQRQAARERSDARRRNLLRKELAWLRRGPKARTSKPKFRVDQAHALMEGPAGEEGGQLDLGTGRRRLGTKVLEAAGLTLAFDDRRVLDGIDLHVGPGERVGIVGPNGAGKTTLLRVLTEELTPDAGHVTWGPTVELATYRQEVVAPPTDVSVLQTITDIAEWVPLANGERLGASRLAERFGFDARLQRTPVASLSGGERRRLALLHVLVSAPNVLILDEPTNDLDIETLQSLEDHLDGFRGTLFVASHDRFVLDRLCDRLLAVEGGRLVPHLDWEAYHEAHRERATATTPSRQTASAIDNRARQERRRQARSIEQRIARLQRERERLLAAFAQVGADYGRATQLQDELADLDVELGPLEDEWLELSLED